MTTPKINTINRGGSRFYVHPETGAKVPGVTSILNMLPKQDFLGPWQAKEVAEYAVDALPEIVGLALRRDKAGAVDWLKGQPRRKTKEAQDRGTDAHTLFEQMAQGNRPTRVHPDLQPFVDAFSEWLDEFQPEFVLMEETVWSETNDYAGSFDAFAIIRGERVWIDYKTTKSLHEEVGLQLAAYRHAEYIIRPDGSRVPMPEADGGAVLHIPSLSPEDWTFRPVRCDEVVFDHFLGLRHKAFVWEKDVKATVLGEPLNSSAPRTRSGYRRAA